MARSANRMMALVVGSALRIRHAAMFRDPANTIASVAAAGGVAILATWFVRWAIVDASWSLAPEASSATCRQAGGACWAVIAERVDSILLGAYPAAERWRPAAACLLFLALYAISAVRSWWGWRLGVPWIGIPAIGVVLLRGGAFTLSEVPTESWGGLPVTLLLSTVGFAGAFPLGVALALGRRSQMPVVRGVSIAYIEIVRGLPMITFLIGASIVLPLLLPGSMAIDKLARAQIAFVIVIAAYVAEAVRGGLQSVARGQYEAAAALGLRWWPATLLVVLPQALRVALPPLVGTFIACFKDTSLVAVIGLFDLLGSARAVLVDPRWVGSGVEVYLFAAAIYFAFCFAVSRYASDLEQSLRRDKR